MDFEQLTLGEIEEIEEYSGRSISEISEMSAGTQKIRTALAWVIKRRSNPAFTIEDARKLTTAEMGALFHEDDAKKA